MTCRLHRTTARQIRLKKNFFSIVEKQFDVVISCNAERQMPYFLTSQGQGQNIMHENKVKLHMSSVVKCPT